MDSMESPKDAAGGKETNNDMIGSKDVKDTNAMGGSDIPVAILNNGLQIPMLGLGTWKSSAGESVKAAVRTAIEVGYRHIDCAWCYYNQRQVGEAIKECIDEGIVSRQDLWITSKLWNTFHKRDDVEPHLKDTLKQLGLSYLDAFLIHWAVTGNEGPQLDPPYEETWLAMEDLVRKGLVRTIGVSNLSVKKLLDMKSYATIFPAINQVELHPFLRQDELLKTCTELGVHVTAYSPLGSPDSADSIKHTGYKLMQHPVVTDIATALNKTPAQVLIRWALQRGTSVIPKSSTPSRITQNIDVLSFQLNNQQFSALSSLTERMRCLHGKFWLKPVTGPYKTLAEFWDDNENETD